MPRGDCYEAAGRLLFERDGEPNVTLCHGLVWGQGRLKGKVLGHGWLEQTDEAAAAEMAAKMRTWDAFPPEMALAEARRMATTVFDYSNDRQLTLPAVLYYAVGGIEVVRRYTIDEARKLVLRTGHWGHWDLPENWNGLKVH